MAIQISGTTVINNSRQLQNIASLDSTTTSTIAAAGVGGATMLVTPSSLSAGSLFYRYDSNDPDNTTLYNRLYISLGGGQYRLIVLAEVNQDILEVGTTATPSVTGVVSSPTTTYTSSGSVDISSLGNDDFIVIYAVGGGGGGAWGPSTGRGPGGGGGALIAAVPKLTAGSTVSFTVGSGGAKPSYNTNAPAGGDTTISFSGSHPDLVAKGGNGGTALSGSGSYGRGFGGAGKFHWPSNGIYSNTAGDGTSSSIPNITGTLSGGVGGGPFIGSWLVGGSSTFGGAGGDAGGGAGSSTYAGTSGRGGTGVNGGSGNAGFVKVYYPR